MSHEAESFDLSPLKLTRQLALIYEYNGEQTNADPRSFTGSEKTKRENAILKQHPHTGYADSIRKNRSMAFFKPYTSWGDFFKGVTYPIYVPSYFIFKSVCHFVDAMISALDCFTSGFLALIFKPFSNELSKKATQEAVDAFYKTRANLVSSLAFVMSSVVWLLSYSVLLLTKTVSTVVCTMTEPEVVEDDIYLKSINTVKL